MVASSDEIVSLEDLVTKVKLEIIDSLNEGAVDVTELKDAGIDIDLKGVNEYREKLAGILRESVSGKECAKETAKEIIKCTIEEHVDGAKATELIGVIGGKEPNNHIMFEILMYKFKQKYGKYALIKWLDKYDLARIREMPSDGIITEDTFYVTEEELKESYKAENIVLSNEEKLEILSTIVFQEYKGFGIIDTIREMEIDGIICGAFGSFKECVEKEEKGLFKPDTSVRVVDKGRLITLRFLKFKDFEEVKKVAALFFRFGKIRENFINDKVLVNIMYDKMRVQLLKSEESYALYLTRYVKTDISPEAFIIKEYTKQGEIPKVLLENLVGGNVTCAFTGRSGAGARTLLTSHIRHINPKHTIRVFENMNGYVEDLMTVYPSRNILYKYITESVTRFKLDDCFCIRDAEIGVCVDLESDNTVARMIQFNAVCALSTLFTHYARDTKDLVLSLRNSLVCAAGWSEKIALDMVIDFLKIDVHLNFTTDGKRYIERISEVVRVGDSFEVKDIVRYDLDTDTYITVNRLSDSLMNYIKRSSGNDYEFFANFINEHWD